MKKFPAWWKGYLSVELKGASPERVFNLCSCNEILLWELKCLDGGYRFCVSAADFKALVGYVRKSGCRMVVLNKGGRPFWVRRHGKRKLFAAGFVMCLLLLRLFTLFIWEIDFTGNTRFTDEMLKKTLEEHGCKIGVRASEVRCDELEMLLREIYPEITWVSAQVRGTGLLIRIRENTGILVGKETQDSPCDLVAETDGLITQIITRSGTPLVKAGDQVVRGQVLISGVVERFNDSKEKTGEILVQADGEVLAETVIEYEDRFAVEFPVKWYTGRERYRLSVRMFGRELCLDGSFGGFECCDAVTWQGDLSWGGYRILPLSWQWTVLREYEESIGIYQEKEAISVARENCNEFFENLLEKGVQIIEKNVRIDMMGDECVTTGTITVIRPIGAAVPIAENTGEQEETDS